MNDALRYIESHIHEKIDLTEVARIACCSQSHLQRMFTFIADVSIAEYIRRRRLALAACDLLNSDIKIIDLASKYGYESPEAFTRAFQAFHGVNPTTARNRGIYNRYEPISIEITISGGQYKVGKKPLMRIEEHHLERVVSFYVNCRAPEEAAWNQLRDWVVRNVNDYQARRFIGCAPKGHHPKGQEHQPNEEEGTHEYLAQMFLLEDEGCQDSYMEAATCDAPRGLFLIGDVVLNEFQADGTIDIGSSMQRSFGVMSQCLQEMGGYEFDLAERPYYEEHIFTNEWFNGDGELAGFKLWLPIRKIS
ncbi:Regulatory protein SoxS [compost metagenome]